MNAQAVNIPWTLVAPLLALQLILMVTALISLVKAEETNGPKAMWAVIIIIGGLLGSVAYFIFGRRNV